MSKKIIFFDADGTIIKNNKVSELTKEAFRKLREKGYILVLSTGRSIPGIQGPLKELEFENKICAAGGVIVIDNEIVQTYPLSKVHLKEILEYFDHYHMVYNLEGNDYIYMKEGQKHLYLQQFVPSKKEEVDEETYNSMVARYNLIDSRTKEVKNPLELEINKVHWYEVPLIYDGKPSPLSYQEIKEQFGNKYNVVPLSLSKVASGGEISEKDVTKSKGMKIILDHFKIDKDDIYAIGDDYNDIDMLAMATHSIALGHAPKEVKEVSDYITEDINHDGFYYAMKHYGLID